MYERWQVPDRRGEFSFVNESKEIMRIRRDGQGRLHLEVSEELEQAAKDFWDILEQFAEANELGTVKVVKGDSDVLEARF